MRRVMWAGLLLIVVAFVWNVGRTGMERGAFYRGVYEACVRTSIIEGRTTSFDLLVCGELEQRARRERWFEQRVEIGN